MILVWNTNCNTLQFFENVFMQESLIKKFGKLYINGKLIRYWIMLYWIWKVKIIY